LSVPGRVPPANPVFANRPRILSEENQDKADAPTHRRSELAEAVQTAHPRDRHSLADKQSDRSIKFGEDRQIPADNKAEDRAKAAAGLLLIRIESSYHSASRVSGLHRIELRDKHLRNLQVDSKHVSCSNCGERAAESLARLFQEPNTDPGNQEDNWNFRFSGAFIPEIRIDTSKLASSIEEILIWNHRPSKPPAKYPGVKAVALWLGTKAVFAGDLESPSPDLQNQELVTRIKLVEEAPNTARRNPPPRPANRTALQDRPLKGSLTSNDRQSRAEGRQELNSSPSDKLSASPTHTVSSKQTGNSQNFKIAPNFHNSDEESLKQLDRDIDSALNEPNSSNRPSDYQKYPSNDVSKDLDLQRHTATHQERSLSKVSRSSQESKRKLGPKIANSNLAKKFFEPSPTMHGRGVPGALQHQDSLKAPNSQISKNRFGSGPIGMDMIVHASHHSNRGQSSDKAVPLKADHARKQLLSGQSTSSIQGPTSEAQFSALTKDYPKLEVCTLGSTRSVRLELYTNWGDDSKIGLSGIEIFDQEGKMIRFPKNKAHVSVTSKQRDNMANDPHYLRRILSTDRWPDGISEPWVTDYDEYHPICIEILLPVFTMISLIRIWNYNVSPPYHTSKAVKNFALYFDKDLKVFGELPRPSGDRLKLLDDAEWIFFTGENKSILKSLDDNDWIGNSHPEMIAMPERGKSLDRLSIRPATGEKLLSNSPESVGSLTREKPKYNMINTPATKGIHLPSYTSPDTGFFYLHRVDPALNRPDNPDHSSVTTDQIDFVFHSAWNGANTFGVRAIELFGMLVSPQTETNAK